MKKEFVNASGNYCVFTDNGIFYKNLERTIFYPYGSITKIEYSLGSLTVEGKAKGEKRAFIYVPRGEEQKEEIKALINLTKEKMKSAPKIDVLELNDNTALEQAEKIYKECLEERIEQKNVEEPKKGKKKSVGLIIAIAVVLLLVILPISSILLVIGIQRNTIYKYKENGNYIDAYRICALMPQTDEIKNLMKEFEPYVWDKAEELYLSGDVQGAHDLINKCNIDYDGYHYVLTGRYQFATMEGLTHIVIPNGITYIPRKAFLDCTALESVVIPNSVTKINENAFEGCTSLKSVVIPDSVTEIDDYAFWKCRSLTDIEIPNSVTKIGEWAFLGCSSLKNITIPNGITEISHGTFFGCESLVKVEIPNSVTRIGNEAFRACDSLTNIVIPDSVTSIGSFAFSSCVSLKSIVIPKNVKKIGQETFYKCESLTSVVIPGTVEAIDERAFYECSSLKRLVIEEGVEKIWERAFYGCKSLTKVVIPSSVTNIGNFAFDDCDSLTIYCRCKETGRWGVAWNGDSPVVWEYTGK